ncbi:hypothetical protein NDU88_004514 [Pleurodeles waltl]|uniref:Secreted protein n=1 Tax=Pleurodeles waltl TaxID=8319 RepID=A0AAV7LK52_PLEWA|nr:hypothetical protein NDU88_004514 [Pleurodeles waltl]
MRASSSRPAHLVACWPCTAYLGSDCISTDEVWVPARSAAASVSQRRSSAQPKPPGASAHEASLTAQAPAQEAPDQRRAGHRRTRKGGPHP